MLGGNIALQVYESDAKDLWGIFRQHHYLSADFNKAAKLYLIYWDEVLVGMFSVLNQPSGSYKYAFRIHRVVVLPDFQGLGIGTKIIDFFGKYYISQGNKLFLRTTHSRFKNHCRDSNDWIEGSSSGKISNAGGKSHELKYRNYDRTRTPFSFEYVGSDYFDKEHKVIVIDDGDVVPSVDELNRLKENYYLIVATGNTKEHSELENTCKELGIRTELLYQFANGEKKKIKKYE